jgi:hypothetical protein
LTDIEVMPYSTRRWAISGRFDGACPHNEEVIPGDPAGGDDLADCVEDGLVGLVEQLGADLRIAVDAQHQLGEVVGSDRHAVNAHGRVLADAVDDRRDLGHHPAVQAALATQWACVDGLQARLELPARPDERNHDVQVGCLVANPCQSLQLKREQLRVANVAEAAAEPDHRVLLRGFERGAAGEAAELVGPEVHGAVHHGPRSERAGDVQQRRAHVRDEALALAACQQPLRVLPVEGFDHHELGAQQPHAVDRQLGDLRRLLGNRQVHVHRRRQRLDGTGERIQRGGDVGRGRYRRGRTGKQFDDIALMDLPGPAVDRDQLAGPQHLRRATGAHHTGHAELAPARRPARSTGSDLPGVASAW